MAEPKRAAATRRIPYTASPLRLLIFMALSIFVVETAVSSFIHGLPLREQPQGFAEAALDALLQILLLSPMLYYFLFRPLLLHIKERKLAEEALEAERARLETVTENIGAGLAIISPDYRTLWANGIIRKMFGGVVGKKCFSAYNALNGICPDCGVREVFEQGTDKVVHEQRGVDVQGKAVWSQIIATPLRDAEGKVTAALELVMPITERKQAEEALQEERNKLRGILDVMPDGIYSVNKDYEIQYINSALESQFGPPDGLRCYAYFHDRSSPCPWCKNDEVFAGKQVHWEMRAEKTGRFYDLFDTPIRNNDGSIVKLEIVRDKTERKRAEEALRKSYERVRSLSAHLQTVRETERTRIAREIHDELGQVLTALKMDLCWTAGRLHGDQPELQGKANAMIGLADDAIRSVKRICTELRPGVLDDLGLAAALEWQASEFQLRSRIPCVVSVQPPGMQLNREQSTALFRIFQEALTNVGRHAGATNVVARLEEDNGDIVLSVVDDGKGITQKQIASRTSFGIMGIKERIDHLGGTVAITGRPEQGTTIQVRIPRKRTETVPPTAS
jgi:PAS domain S-box-containing protein